MADSVERSYACCGDITRRSARNFYYTFLSLPAGKRRSMFAVYSFMRRCDDVADSSAELKTRKELLEQWRSALTTSSPRLEVDHSILPAFYDTMEQFSIPLEYFHEILNGLEMDLEVTRYQSFDDLRLYCYRVASAVGLVCIHIFGFYSPEALERAESCGIAFQLTNILRDLKEDAARNRIYLPQEDLRTFSYSEEELLAGACNSRFKKLMAFQVERARRYYREAYPLLPLVERSSRASLASMMAVYEGILNRIENSSYDVFRRRISLPAFYKLALVLRSYWNFRLQGGPPSLR